MNKDLLITRALNFTKEWEPLITNGNTMERQHDREFMGDFYGIFGISKSLYRAGFEYTVKGKRIDSLLPHELIIEMESQGVSLVSNSNAGYEQALRYAYALPNEIKPKYILACDFENFYLKNPENGQVWTTTLYDLPKNIDMFNFLIGYEQQEQQRQAVVNSKAAESISNIYRHILNVGVQPNAASLLMTRIVFCLFADDTQIFEHNGVFQKFIESSSEDGSDLLLKLSSLFKQLNTPTNNWIGGQREFGYINGGLFALDISKFTTDLGLTFDTNVRNALIKASKMDWSKISPVIFGSMFEGALDSEKRHNLGAHFTSEANITKVVDSLFMNDLHKEFDTARHKSNSGGARTKALNALHDKITHLTFLDPACGSGNFLIVAYRELRRLEHDIIDALSKEQLKEGNMQLSWDFASKNIKVEVSQFYGIEIQPYAVSIARVGMWLMDHLMNLEASALFGELVRRIPLHSGANIKQANALTNNWTNIFGQKTKNDDPTQSLNIDNLDYILGNPPFLGNSIMSDSQKSDLTSVTKPYTTSKKLDFVTGWFFKAAEIMEKNPRIQTAFVSTKSIMQGIQVTPVWQTLFDKFKIKINFVHQTFKWDNNGAEVYVRIIGFSKIHHKINYVFEYPDVSGEPLLVKTPIINQYGLAKPIQIVSAISKPLSPVPKMIRGSRPTDGQNLIFNPIEYSKAIKAEPWLKSYLLEYVDAKSFLHSPSSKYPRYLLYLKNAPISLISKSNIVNKRLDKVANYRNSCRKDATKELGKTPISLELDHINFSRKLLIPRHTSENRDYFTVGYLSKEQMPSDATYEIENAEPWLFTMLSSSIHFAWLKTIAGSLEGRYRYSSNLIYNTFIMPRIDEQTKEYLTKYAQLILTCRENYIRKGSTIADLYNPLYMPEDLRKFHERADKYVDSLYGLKNPSNDERVSILFSLYENKINQTLK
ncbi:N-6 DNA methylase [Pediococcus pentosaceus]|uniref:DNA methyltransferase n=1 Tax=Pediococcus pentosaceus TaxID=1255 RepID=UPI0021E8CC82|nr:DNA methyltransferase [Pediococcus pentosaceus]MCV3330481.1 N-6 DNA methylase [Pediococcus pentosaceus]